MLMVCVEKCKIFSLNLSPFPTLSISSSLCLLPYSIFASLSDSEDRVSPNRIVGQILDSSVSEEKQEAKKQGKIIRDNISVKILYLVTLTKSHFL